GVIFIALIGWRLVPSRDQSGLAGFETEAYITEARVPADSKADGLSLGEIDQAVSEFDAQVLGLIRNDIRLTAPGASRKVHANDILSLECDAETLAKVLSALGLELAGEKTKNESSKQDDDAQGAETAQTDQNNDDTALIELAVLPSSSLLGRSA